MFDLFGRKRIEALTLALNALRLDNLSIFRRLHHLEARTATNSDSQPDTGLQYMTAKDAFFAAGVRRGEMNDAAFAAGKQLVNNMAKKAPRKHDPAQREWSKPLTMAQRKACKADMFKKFKVSYLHNIPAHIKTDYAKKWLAAHRQPAADLDLKFAKGTPREKEASKFDAPDIRKAVNAHVHKVLDNGK